MKQARGHVLGCSALGAVSLFAGSHDAEAAFGAKRSRVYGGRQGLLRSLTVAVTPPRGGGDGVPILLAMDTLTLPTLSAGGVLTALLFLMWFIPRAPFAWQKALGFLSLVLGGAACGALLMAGGLDAVGGRGRDAAEYFLMLYVLGAATWLAWKEAKPF